MCVLSEANSVKQKLWRHDLFYTKRCIMLNLKTMWFTRDRHTPALNTHTAKSDFLLSLPIQNERNCSLHLWSNAQARAEDKAKIVQSRQMHCSEDWIIF